MPGNKINLNPKISSTNTRPIKDFTKITGPIFDKIKFPFFHVDASVDTPGSALYVGAFRKLNVRVNAVGLSIDDFTFEIPDGPKAGIISLSNDDEDTHPASSIMLIAGVSTR